MFLPDVNFWLALNFDSHVHHPAAKNWFDALTDQTCFFCRMTQQGFLRLATNPTVFGKYAVTLAQAWQQYDTYLSDSRISFANEPAGIESHWRSFTQQEAFSPKLWNDAYLAAFALTAQLQVVTFDTGFAQFKSVNSMVLP